LPCRKFYYAPLNNQNLYEELLIITKHADSLNHMTPFDSLEKEDEKEQPSPFPFYGKKGYPTSANDNFS